MSLSERVQEHAYKRRWLILLVLCFSLLVIVLDNTILNVAIPTLVARPRRRPTASSSGWSTRTRSCSPGCCSPPEASVTGSAAVVRSRSGSSSSGSGSLFSAFATTRGPAHRDARVHGHRRRVHHAGDAVDHHQRLPDRRSAARPSACGRAPPALGDRARPDHRRLPARALLLGLDLPREPPDRHRRARRRRLPHPDVEGPERRHGSTRSARCCRSSGSTALALRRSSRRPQNGWTDPTILAAFGVAVVLLGAFVWWERTTDHPMLDVRFFKNPRFTRREPRHHADVLRDVRRDLPADPVPAVRARLLAARGRHPPAAVRRGSCS